MKGYTVEPISYQEAKPWILKKHYARRVPSISHSFGLFKSKELVGVCTYGLPASPHLCMGICGERYKDIVIEFNRMCLLDNEPNEASFFIGKTLKALPMPQIVVSFADTGQDHTGYIYQATNWVYLGVTDYGRKPRSDRITGNKHGRHETNMDVPLVYRTQKHRYVYFRGSKRQKHNMQLALKYPVLPYPKGESKRYDASAEFHKQVRMF